MPHRSNTWNSYLAIASQSDVGMRRSNNQDSFTVALANDLEHWRDCGHLFIVADGMGAHAAGELASELAATHIPHLYHKYNELSAPEALKRAVIEANAEINRRGEANEEFHNMGTTCSILSLLPQGAVVAHVGDSRVYRIRDHQLEQLTFDHSLVWEMRAAGQISGDDSSHLVPKNVITRSLGPYPDVRVDMEGPFPVEVGDVFLLCSDGLTGLVEDEELASLLSNLEPEDAVQVLVDLANLRGGHDNTTAIVVKVIHQELATYGENATPLTIGAKPIKGVHPVAWAMLAASVVAAVLLGLLQSSWLGAAIPGALAVALAIWIIVQASGALNSGTVVGAGRRFGKGPYTHTESVDGDAFLAQLEEINEELQRAALDEGWSIDWAKLNEFIESAHAAVSQSDQKQAIQSYSKAISFMMDQLRAHSRKQGSDSSVDL